MKQELERLGTLTTKSAMLDALVEDAVGLTQSTIGYFAVMNDAEDELTMLGWSKSAMGACSMIDKPIIYPLVETGLWGDAVRERQPSITNDYENSTRLTKRGYPDGHVQVGRHINVPVWEGDKIRGILGVGNKDTDYSAEDAAVLQEYANAAWVHFVRVS